MSPLLLLIALTLTLAIALVVMQVFSGFAGRRQIVRTRMGAGDFGINSGFSSVLRERPRSTFPLAAMLPVSQQAGERMSRQLEQAGSSLRVGEYLAIRLLFALGIGALVAVLLNRVEIELPLLRILAVVVAAIVGWMLPRISLARRRAKRLRRIEDQLPDALTAIAKSLRAGSGILQGLTYAAHETPPPLGTELQSALRDLQLGAEAEDVFSALSERVGSHHLDIAVTAIVIQRSVGGNLAEILFNVTNTIRERLELQREIRVLTSRQRLTSYLMALLPVGVAIMFNLLNPNMGRQLVTTTPGHLALAGGIALELFGIWLINRLAVIDV